MAGVVLIIFGLIQGLTEFLPISSSGHLAAAGYLLGQPEHQLVYIVLVNIGTWLALVWSTRRQLMELAQQATSGHWQLPAKIGLATLPAGLVGWLALDWLSPLGDQPAVVIIMLMGVGLLMLAVPRPDPNVGLVDNSAAELNRQVSWRAALGIGGLQAVALIPGASRLGITILGGLAAGLPPATAANWSFLLALPVTLGAILRVLVSADGWEQLAANWPWLLAANLVSFLVGLVAIRWLLASLPRWSLRPFGWYRLGLGLVLILLLVWTA